MPRTSDTSSRKAPRTGFLDPFAQFGVRPDRLIAGIDEVGRGALAGPVTAAAVILPRDVEIQGLADSKTLTPSRRTTVAAAVQQVAIAVSVAHVEPAVIDAVGIAEATRRAMLGALAGLSVDPHLALIDGLPVELGIEAYALVKGDSLLASVAAASVVAKVARDSLMAELDQAHPGYGFAVHKGYGTAEHLAALERLGPSPVHRMSFAPCSQRRLF
ncbi:ribonuclease HII [Coriobacteriia bacterium Es71-Z0120]|uniref:ribonuclease HII n=1 Tax=Parvivirga hydrogeniphila TaxID=2939460 RepID=UPI002260C9D7|nr:ribonuclease HII [Parvivirga hydrogeniphila]MCL4079577.1 ribonuclease HII [Parvivirga hydrogeniphila]